MTESTEQIIELERVEVDGRARVILNEVAFAGDSYIATAEEVAVDAFVSSVEAGDLKPIPTIWSQVKDGMLLPVTADVVAELEEILCQRLVAQVEALGRE